MRLLIEKGGNVNAENSSKRTPLHIIVDCITSNLHNFEVQKSDECLKLLLKSLADPNLRDIAGSTPLHIAAMHSNVESSNLLIANGANIYSRYYGYECTALELLLKYCPESAITSLDNCITINPNPGSCLLYTSPSPRDLSTSRMPSSA